MTTEIHPDKDFLYHNQTYCDWRVSMSCKGGQIYELLYVSNFILVLLVAIACIILLWYRMGHQGYTVFSPKIPGAGFIRPNPVEGFLVWVIPWLIGRMLYITILWTDVFKDNYLVLETLQLYWTCCAIGYAWFVIGTYLQIGSHLNSKQRPNNKLSERYLVLMTIILPMMIWPVTIASGYFRNSKNVRVANMLMLIKYILWSVWCVFGVLGTYYFRRELCNMLRYHISATKASDNSSTVVGRIERMQFGLKKIRFVLFTILLSYLYLVIYCPLTAISLWTTTHSEPLDVFLFVAYAFLNPLCVVIVVGTISIRIIQSCRRKLSKTPSITEELIYDNKSDLAVSDLAVSTSNNNHSTKGTPDIIISQHQFDYSDKLNFAEMRAVDEIEIGPEINESNCSNCEKNDWYL